MHDTRISISLLTQLNKKDILFYDIAIDYNPNNLQSHMGLVVGKATRTGLGTGTGEYEARCDFIPPPDKIKKVRFDDWWNKIVLVDAKHKSILTRKDVVLTVANQDGGAHIDPNLNEAYADLTRFNGLGYHVIVNGKEQKFIVGPELASIRQIAYEVLKSLKDEFPEYFS